MVNWKEDSGRFMHSPLSVCNEQQGLIGTRDVQSEQGGVDTDLKTDQSVYHYMDYGQV